MSTFIVTAHNPKGLDYSHATTTGADVVPVIARIANMGATDIRINGHLVSDELVADAQLKFTIK